MKLRPSSSDFEPAVIRALSGLGRADHLQVAQRLHVHPETAQRWLARCRELGSVTRTWDMGRRTFVYALPDPTPPAPLCEEERTPAHRFLISVRGANSSASAAHCSDLTRAAIEAGMRPFTALDLATQVWCTWRPAHFGVYGIEYRGLA